MLITRAEWARRQAALRADAMMERGDLEGAAVWQLVVRVIGDLQSTAGQTRH